MFLLLDLLFCFLEWCVQEFGSRRANWFAFFVGLAIGGTCLALRAPAWASVAFAAATVDALTLKYGGHEDA